MGVQNASSTVWLLPPSYYLGGRDGRASFTTNLWFKAGDTKGQLFQYLLSQTGDADGHEWGPNQVLAALLGQPHHDVSLIPAFLVAQMLWEKWQ